MVYVIELLLGATKFRDTTPECPHGCGPGLKLHLNSSKCVGCWLQK